MKEHEINNVMEFLNLFKELNKEMNVNMMLTLLEVAKGKGITGRELEDKLDLKHATAARMLRYFDRLQSPGKPGLGLIYCELDPTDYKAKLRYLSEDGQAFIDKLGKALGRHHTTQAKSA